MKAKLLVCLIFLCGGWMILTGEVHSAKVRQKPDKIYYNTNSPVSDASMPAAASRYTPFMGGTKYAANCFSIANEVGMVIEHSQIGDTWYDFQKNGSMGRMISVSSEGHRHVSWHYTNAVYPGTPRYIKGNCEPAGVGLWVGGTTGYNVDGGPPGNQNPGYVNQTNLPDGTPIMIYHRTAGTPIWYTTIAADNEPCLGIFSRIWDVPDWILNSPTANPMYWPKGEVKHDPVTGRDYIHVCGTEGNTAGGMPVMIAYTRCWIKDSTGMIDPMYCQSYVNGATATYRMLPGANGGGAFSTISHFDSSCSITPVVVVSPVSPRVAIAFLKPNNPNGSCDRWSDCCYIESMNNGDDWIDGTNWPPAQVNITNFPELGTERCANDLSACYDYQDSLHIVYVAGQYDPSDGSLYYRSRLYHWSKKDGTSMIASQMADGAAPGAHNLNIAKMSISAQDPVYHPGGDSVYLYCIWTQFDSSDRSAAGWGNGDILSCGSNSAGAMWGGAYRLTNTHTPGCAPGNCLSEHWSSLAQNMYDGGLHIEYICDKDAGGAIQDAGTTWMNNPVMYLHLHVEPPIPPCHLDYQIVSPHDWYYPPLKVTPGGTRTLIFKLYNIGNNSNCYYSVSSDNSCIICNVPPTHLDPGDSATIAAVIYGSGACNGTYIDGKIVITTSDPYHPTDSLGVQAVVANDYYECPRDPVTYDSLENGVLRMYVNANTQEWIEDIGTYAADDTVHQVFFQGGAFVATTQNNDTLVGRYMGNNDQHALAREKLYLNSYADFWLEYSWNVAIHDLNPPVDTKWWWFEVLHEDVFFKPTASDALKHSVIKFVTVERHAPPGWWPSQPTFTGYEDTYIGMMMDIDAPWDTLGNQNGRNRAGYDATNHIAWQKGWQWPGNPHPEYADYYAGMALIAGNQIGESITPYGTQNVRNDSTVYKVSPWGWRDGQFYRLAKNNIAGVIQDPDSLVDRSQIVTARMIPAGSDLNARASFTVVEVAAPGGLSQLQDYTDSARAWVDGKPLILCGDCNCDGIEDVGDLICKINFLYKGYSAPACGPLARLDCNNSGSVEIGDIITEINYLYKGSPASTIECPGVW